MFLACSAGQLAGLGVVAAGRSPLLLAASTLLLLSLLGATAFYRRRFLRSAGHALRLAGLYHS